MSMLHPLKPSHEISERTKKLPKKIIKARKQSVLRLHAEGKTTEQIAVALNMHPSVVTRDINDALDEMLHHYADPTPQQTFVRYAAFNFAIINKLQKAADRFFDDPETTQYSSLVSALKAQSELYDKIINKGLEFGVVQKRKATETLRKSRKEIKLMLQREVKIMQQLTHEESSHVKGQTIQLSETLIRKIRIPEQDSTGKIRKTVNDWKYKTKEYDLRGRPIPIKGEFPQAKELPPGYQEKLLNLTEEILKAEGIKYTKDPDTGEILPRQDIDPDKYPILADQLQKQNLSLNSATLKKQLRQLPPHTKILKRDKKL